MRIFYLENTELTKKSAEEVSGKTRLGYQILGKINSKKLYIASKVDLELLAPITRSADKNFLKVITIESQNKLLSAANYPKFLGNHSVEDEIYDFEDFIESFGIGTTVKLCLIIPFGRALGDSIIFLSVVSELFRRTTNSGKNLEVHLITISTTESIDILFKNSGLFSSINHLPYPLDELRKFDGCIDFIRSHLRSDATWIDSLFELCGIRPETVPAHLKRNKIKLDSEISNQIREVMNKLKREKDKPIIIFHHQASTPIRSIPFEISCKLLAEMSEISNYHFVSLTPLEFTHPCFTDLSHVSTDLERYVALIASADGFITVDTSFYHFADAVGTPGLVLFTTSEPFRFATYYPLVNTFQLADGDKLGTIYWSNNSDDIKFIHGLWSTVEAPMLISMMQNAIDKKARLSQQYKTVEMKIGSQADFHRI